MKRPVAVIVTLILLGLLSVGGARSVIREIHLQSVRLIPSVIMEGWLILSFVTLIAVPLLGRWITSSLLICVLIVFSFNLYINIIDGRKDWLLWLSIVLVLINLIWLCSLLLTRSSREYFNSLKKADQ
jgi:hypothetical protein